MYWSHKCPVLTNLRTVHPLLSSPCICVQKQSNYQLGSWQQKGLTKPRVRSLGWVFCFKVSDKTCLSHVQLFRDCKILMINEKPAYHMFNKCTWIQWTATDDPSVKINRQSHCIGFSPWKKSRKWIIHSRLLCITSSCMSTNDWSKTENESRCASVNHGVEHHDTPAAYSLFRLGWRRLTIGILVCSTWCPCPPSHVHQHTSCTQHPLEKGDAQFHV